MTEQMELISKKIDQLSKALGAALFSDLVDFDMEISESDYAYKILMGRRYFVLHSGLKPVIKYAYGDDFKESGCFLTNLSIALHDLRDKKVLIIDDTLLHGRAIGRIIEDLVACGCKRENIRVKIFLRNLEAEIVNPSLLELVDCKRPGNTNKWRFVSGKIVDAFMELGWPYLYYLPYYETSLCSDRAARIKGFLEEKNLHDNAVLIQKKHGVSTYLYRIGNDFPMSRDALIRIYKYEKVDKMLVVPYVYLKPLTYEQIAVYFKILGAKGVVRCRDGSAFLESAGLLGVSRMRTQYAYSLLTYICSVLCGLTFLESLGLGDWERSKATEEKSLDCNVSVKNDSVCDIIKEIRGKYVADGNELLIRQNADIECVIKALDEGRRESTVQAEMNLDYFLDHYLKLSSERDEQLAKEGKERMSGIEIERIEQYSSDKDKMWKKIMEVIDTGRATIAIDSIEIKNKVYVDSLLYAGEQNTACNDENLMELAYPLLQYEMYCKEYKVSGKKKAEIKNKLIKKILEQKKELRDKVSTQEINVLKQDSFAQNYEAYYLDKYPMFREAFGIPIGMKIEKELEDYGERYKR